MLLIRTLLIRTLRRVPTSRERGSSLIAVLGVMVLGLILTTLVSSAVVKAYSFSSSAGNCSSQPVPGTYSSSTGGLSYTATVQFDAGSGWQAGCPTLSASRVRIVSTGAAQAKGVSGASTGDSRSVEAIYNYLTPGIKPTGAAVQFNGGGDIEANSSFDLSESSGLIVKNGDFDCSKNNSVLNGNLVVTGDLNFTGGCTVNGNVAVSGAANLGSGAIHGNLSASSVVPNPPRTQVSGTYTQTSAVPPTPPWVDVAYTPSDWVDSTGAPFQVKTAPGGISCTLSSGNLGGSTLGKPVIIDLRSCPNGPSAGNNTSITLTSDVVIFAQQFNFSGINSLSFTSSNSAVHRLWLITPDNVPDGQPTCNRTAAAPDTQGDFQEKNNLTASDVFATTNTVQAMLYTPCAMAAKNNLTWNGQLYTGQYSTLNNNPTFTYDQVGIAGYDLTTGAAIPAITTARPGTLISNRDLAGG
jgi:hypothetical protein